MSSPFPTPASHRQATQLFWAAVKSVIALDKRVQRLLLLFHAGYGH
jgi:hypothetical protein